MNILITGVAGFIASHVAVYLVNKYPDINFIGIDKLTYCSNIHNIDQIKDKPNFKFIKLDITNIDHTKYVFEINNIKIVLHFAAYTHVDHSFANSILFTHNNIEGTHILLEVSKLYKIQKFIHVSTDEVYGDKDILSTESATLDPTNPYAATKAAAEHLVKSYYLSFGLPIIITRGNNVYGPKQYPEKVIPKFILKLLNGEKCPIQGSGKQKRSFLYIDDVSRAFDIILQHGIIGEVYNIGSDDEISVLDIVKELVSRIYPNDEIINHIEYTTDRNFNDQRYNISLSKLKDLGWKKEYNFESGLEKTIEWYKNNIGYWEDETRICDNSM